MFPKLPKTLPHNLHPYPVLSGYPSHTARLSACSLLLKSSLPLLFHLPQSFLPHPSFLSCFLILLFPSCSHLLFPLFLCSLSRIPPSCYPFLRSAITPIVGVFTVPVSIFPFSVPLPSLCFPRSSTCTVPGGPVCGTSVTFWADYVSGGPDDGTSVTVG